MEDCWNSAPPKAREQEDALDRLFKTKNPDLYYENSHIECYYFCQQCKDYFETARAKGYKRVFFATSFLKDRIFFYLQQYKNRVEQDRAALSS